MYEGERRWRIAKDGNRKALEIFKRHYSYRNFNRKSDTFAGAGKTLVLVTEDYSALWVWRKELYIATDLCIEVSCAVFRNESRILSSELILEAEDIWIKRNGIERFYTFVDAGKIKSSNPGYCFLRAGWDWIGKTGKGLAAFEKYKEHTNLDGIYFR